MRLSIFIMLFFLITSFGRKEEAIVLRHRLIVQPASQLLINGKTNVNKFQCAIAKYCGADTLILQEGGPKGKPIFIRGFVGLEANSFDCGMAAMTHDFDKTIKAKEHPIVGIDFKSFERVPTYGCSTEKFIGTLSISMAGISHTFDVDCTVETGTDGLISLKGGRVFQFSDFSLTAPSRMMGLVKVDDTLDVQFHLVLKLDANRW